MNNMYTSESDYTNKRNGNILFKLVRTNLFNFESLNGFENKFWNWFKFIKIFFFKFECFLLFH